MKIRLDFVTNSSSSCFVVETGEGCKEVKKALKLILKGYYIAMPDEDRLPFLKVFSDVYVYTQEMHDRNNSEREEYKWSDFCWRYQLQENIGKVLIMSASDNSIPWDICQIIESRFRTSREHLG